jgi:hypothetical protein
MNPTLTYQLAQARRAELLREAEEYRRARRAGLTVLMRLRTRIPRFPSGRAAGAARASSGHRHPA